MTVLMYFIRVSHFLRMNLSPKYISLKRAISIESRNIRSTRRISRLISCVFCAEYSSISIPCGPRAIYLVGVEFLLSYQSIRIFRCVTIKENLFLKFFRIVGDFANNCYCVRDVDVTILSFKLLLIK